MVLDHNPSMIRLYVSLILYEPPVRSARFVSAFLSGETLTKGSHVWGKNHLTYMHQETVTE